MATNTSLNFNPLQTDGTLYIDNQYQSINTTVTAQTTIINNIVNNTINLLSNFSIPSTLVSSFLGTQKINTQDPLPGGPYTFYEWSEPIFGGSPCLVVCSENPSDILNALSCSNLPSLNAGAGFSGFQTTGTVGMYKYATESELKGRLFDLFNAI